MRSEVIVANELSKIPKERLIWCDAIGGCACMGCVNSVVTKEEWERWKESVNYCECCGRKDT